MNVFVREMKANRKSLIIWCLSIVALIIIGMAKYSALKSSGADMEGLLKGMPQAVQSMFGMGYLNIMEIKGYYAVLYVYFLLMVGVHASMLGANIISKEEQDKTADFLLSKPAKRSQIITGKLSAAALNVLIFNLAALISSVVLVGYYNKGKSINKEIFLLMFGMLIFQLIFLSLGTLLASFNKNSKTAASLSTAVILSAYMLSILIDLNSKLDNLKYLTPFKYFQAKDVITADGYQAKFIILSIILITSFIAGTYLFYSKRDMNV
jgi:ABC-2 type transporter.